MKGFFFFWLFSLFSLLVPAKLKQMDLQLTKIYLAEMKMWNLNESGKGIIYSAEIKLREGNTILRLQN